MRPLKLIRTCLDVTDEDIQAALAPARSLVEPGPRVRCWALLRHMCKIARPVRGAPNILLVLAHVATRDWIDGEVVVKLIGDDDLSVLEVFIDEGFALTRELGPLQIMAPLSEFANAVRLHPHRILPLAVHGRIESRRFELRTTRELRRASLPPSFSAVSASLMPMVAGDLRTLPPIVSHPPKEGEPHAGTKRQFRALTLPPHLKQALAPLKKR